MISEIQNKIKELKKQKDICILAHIYQNREIVEIADFAGDTLQLAEYAENIKNENIVFCGVKSMAETVKILSPSKHIYLSDISAVCPLTEQITPELITQMKAVEPERTVVSHINTTAAVKAVSDVCVTSENAVNIVKGISDNRILFIPDCNLGDYVKRSVPEKDIRLVQSSCPVHSSVTVKDVEKAKKLYPYALLLVCPECPPDVVELADYVGSATGIINFSKQSENKNFIISAEANIKDTLQHECPDKNFCLLSKNLICNNIHITTLCDVYNVLKSVENNNYNEIMMTDNEIQASIKCILKMRETKI